MDWIGIISVLRDDLGIEGMISVLRDDLFKANLQSLFSTKKTTLENVMKL